MMIDAPSALPPWRAWAALPFDLWLDGPGRGARDPLVEYYSWLVLQPSPHKGEAARRRDVLELLLARRAR